MAARSRNPPDLNSAENMDPILKERVEVKLFGLFKERQNDREHLPEVATEVLEDFLKSDKRRFCHLLNRLELDQIF
jgi:hypothetical protein